MSNMYQYDLAVWAITVCHQIDGNHFLALNVEDGEAWEDALYQTGPNWWYLYTCEVIYPYLRQTYRQQTGILPVRIDLVGRNCMSVDWCEDLISQVEEDAKRLKYHNDHPLLMLRQHIDRKLYPYLLKDKCVNLNVLDECTLVVIDEHFIDDELESRGLVQYSQWI